MPDNNLRSLVDHPAVPLTFVVSRDQGHWHIQGFYHGTSVAEALHPVLVCERWLDHTRAPINASWAVLYREVAIAFEDLAAGDGVVGERQ